jgi:hypothetical protein
LDPAAQTVPQQFSEIQAVQRAPGGGPIETNAAVWTAEGFRERQTLFVVSDRMRQQDPDLRGRPRSEGQRLKHALEIHRIFGHVFPGEGVDGVGI